MKQLRNILQTKWLYSLIICFGINLSSCFANPKQPFDIQGHRGARGLAPENTIAGFHTAINAGATTLEFDIGVSKDIIPVIFHDTSINTDICLNQDGTQIQTDLLGNAPFIKDRTLSEIKSFDCGSLNPDKSRFPEPPRKNIPGEKIPTLQELFDLLDEYPEKNIWCNIELKTNSNFPETIPIHDFADAVIDVIETNDRVSRVNIQSFQWNVLEYIRNRQPEILLAGLMGQSSYKAVNESKPSPWLNGIHFDRVGGTSLAVLLAAKKYIDIFSPFWKLVIPADPLFLGSSVQEIQAAGFKVIPWTVNKTHIMKQLIDEGVDGIITDYPDSLKFVLDELEIP
ncbi:MAG TPA: glycerophosphodiester phosphodiesterase family protein [Candidatus Marinimicrobia bacterium]|jgi:glycerophosphoryl diester phosphodiesterase|nr:glycerophosphodiester phosphodiesterase family protein [Candidatus Neomarinimicrobiota bacterium]HJL75404.1 glycerophosphodiester phosphodiesterase family protein [Candidatus Neomarinimicrobiota bacterium]HJM70133.1 glycerophosphodiester phosphodiesterase family protein [Candidatus Neomarinimicrobiota bacterium]|tara:strand:- start:240 stop:1262 length:1023 start_codon:yes stop_codon:yes gene_type:complete